MSTNNSNMCTVLNVGVQGRILHINTLHAITSREVKKNSNKESRNYCGFA